MAQFATPNETNADTMISRAIWPPDLSESHTAHNVTKVSDEAVKVCKIIIYSLFLFLCILSVFYLFLFLLFNNLIFLVKFVLMLLMLIYLPRQFLFIFCLFVKPICTNRCICCNSSISFNISYSCNYL